MSRILGILALVLVFLPSLSLQAQAARRTMVAVLPFPTRILDPENQDLQGFGDMFAENLMTRLGELPSVQVLERVGIEQVVQELGLQRNSEAFFDSSTLLQSGKLGMTDFLVLGSALAVDREFVQLNLRVVEKNTGRIAMSRQVNGLVRELFEKSDELISIMLAAMDAGLSSAEENRVFPRGRLLYKAMTAEGSLLERIEALEKALGEYEDSREGWKVLAMLYREAGDASLAFEAMNRVLALSPGDNEALFFTAGLAFEAGRRSEAKTAFATCADAGYRRLDSYFHLGLIEEFDSAGRKFGPDADLAAAQAHYRAAIEIDPKNAPSLFNLGYSYLVQATREAKTPQRQYEFIKAEVEYLSRYLECAPQEDAGRLAAVREQVEQHKLFLKAMEAANK